MGIGVAGPAVVANEWRLAQPTRPKRRAERTGLQSLLIMLVPLGKCGACLFGPCAISPPMQIFPSYAVSRGSVITSSEAAHSDKRMSLVPSCILGGRWRHSIENNGDVSKV